MEHLRQRDINALWESIRRIYSDLNPDSLPETVVETASRIIPCGISVYHNIDNDDIGRSATIAANGKWNVPFESFCSPDYAHEHPFANLLSEGRLKPHPYKEDIERRFLKRLRTLKGSPGDEVVKISDVLTDSQFRRLAIYNDLAKKNNTDYQMGLPLIFNRDSYTVITFNRDKMDFSEKERLLLGMLGPHIIQAFKNAEITGALKGDKTGIGTMLMDGKAKDLKHETMKTIGITMREAEILKWIAQGKTNAEISGMLNISLNTVKTHLAHIYQKLGVENRVAAARFIIEDNK
jgi:DNA-binding CsgD family transcriptional regulator